jgi:hypothetical protein
MPNTSRFYLAADDGNGVRDLLDIVMVSQMNVVHTAMRLKELIWSDSIEWPDTLPDAPVSVLMVLPRVDGAFLLKREADAGAFFSMDLFEVDPKRLIMLPKPTTSQNFQMMASLDAIVDMYFI